MTIVRGARAGYIGAMAFGIGFQELVIVALIFLVIFGPSKLPEMARDLGRFVGEARRSIDEFKEELTASHDEDEEDDRRDAKLDKRRDKRGERDL